MTSTPTAQRPSHSEKIDDSDRVPALQGLYALKPWYAARLAPVAGRLTALGVSPDAVSAAGVAFGALAGALLAVLPPTLLTGLLVAGSVAARLGCANLDGTLARHRPPRPFGRVVNELGDRLADLALLAGFTTHLGWGAAGLMLAATLPSWVSLAVSSAGGPRVNGGPVGKTERCALAVSAAATGWYLPVAGAIALGSVLTAALRLVQGRAAVSA